MKVLMVLERDFPPDLRVENEIKSLLSFNHEIILACFSLKQKEKQIVFDWCGSKVYKRRISRFIFKTGVGALKFGFYFQFWKKFLESIIEEEKVDAIHVHDLPLARIGSDFQKKYPLKFTLDLHENWPAFLKVSKHTNTFLGKMLSSNKQWEKYELEQCKKADNIIVVVDEAKERIINLGIGSDKITVVSNYPETSDFDDLPSHSTDEGKIILYYAGGLTEHRGIQYIIQAMPEVVKKHSNIELRIYGTGTYKLNLEQITQELQMEEHVIFFGQVTYKVVLKELVKSDITLIPHVKNEHTDSTIPHKLFQYIYAGKPVLASNCKPIERIVKDVDAGYIYTWNDIKMIEQKIIQLIDNLSTFDPARLREAIKKNYLWGIESKKLLKIYQQ
jgi:glycosyltransferase involved in cell wall biosynthesis